MMLATQDPCAEFALPAVDVRGASRRLLLAGVALAVGVAAVLLLGDQVHAFAHALSRAVALDPRWGLLAVAFEVASIAGYAVLLSLVAGRSTSRMAIRESAQVTLAGTAVTRVLPTAGLGGLALTLWTLRRAGLPTGQATRTLLAFLVLLYSVFLGSIVLSGGALALGFAHAHGPSAIGAAPAGLALLAIVAALAASARKAQDDQPSAIGRAVGLVGHGVRDALSLARGADPRLGGAAAYWLFDAAVLWSMLHAFGSPPSLLIVALAYFVGQAATTLPIPGMVAGGMAGVLIACGVPAGLALPGVLAYRTVAVWLPVPLGVAALARLRSTVAGWTPSPARAR